MSNAYNAASLKALDIKKSVSDYKNLFNAPFLLGVSPPLKMTKLAGALLLSALSAGSYAQFMLPDPLPLTYDGTTDIGTSRLGTFEQFTYSTMIPQLLGIGATDIGVVYMGAELYSNIPGSSYSFLAGETDLTINFSTGATPQFVVGGYAEGWGYDSVAYTVDQNVVNNSLKILQGQVDGPAYAGLSNTTYIRGDVVGVNGSNASANGNIALSTYGFDYGAINNQLTVDGSNSSVSGNAVAGQAVVWMQTGNATGGTASATGNSSASGGATTNVSFNSSYTLNADNNSIDIKNNASVGGKVYGGNSSMFIQTGHAVAGSATADTGISTASGDTYIDLSSPTVTANDNEVNIQQATVGNSIYGGYAELSARSGNATAGNATGNGAIITLALSSVDASFSNLQANQNNIEFNGNLQSGSIYGGYIRFDLAAGTATGGTSNLSGVNLTGTKAVATNNTVTIRRGAQLAGGTSIYGGYLEYNPGLAPESYDVFSGNTLNFHAPSTSVDRLANFEHYNFSLHPSLANMTTPVVTANDVLLGADISNMDAARLAGQASTFNVIGIHSGNILNAGDQFVLIQAGNMTGNAVGATDIGVTQVQQGISLLYNVQTEIDLAGKKVTATILGCNTSLGEVCVVDSRNPGSSAAYVNPQLQALSEAYLSGLQLVSRGGDIVAYDVFNVINEQNQHAGLKPFVLISAQHNRYSSGSHVKSNDYLLTGGLSYQQNNLTAAAILETGWGNYSTHNSFVNATEVRGDGKNNYYGLGLFGRYDFENNLYIDASVRFGKNRNKFDTKHIIHSTTGENANYTVKSNYVSAHIGGGYVLKITDKNNIDFSAKYLWGQLNGKNIYVASDGISFKSIKSSRVRFDASLSHQYNEAITLNAGLGYDYEFDSKTKATAYTFYSINEPSVKGGTGVFSLGANVTPTANQKLNLGFKLNAYTGKRRGVGGYVKVNYAF